MTSFFQYDEMTWDKVAELPRDTPLVLPLGSGYDWELVASQIGSPSRAGLLPPFLSAGVADSNCPTRFSRNTFSTCSTVYAMMDSRACIVSRPQGLIHNPHSFFINPLSVPPPSPPPLTTPRQLFCRPIQNAVSDSDSHRTYRATWIPSPSRLTRSLLIQSQKAPHPNCLRAVGQCQ